MTAQTPESALAQTAKQAGVSGLRAGAAALLTERDSNRLIAQMRGQPIKEGDQDQDQGQGQERELTTDEAIKITADKLKSGPLDDTGKKMLFMLTLKGYLEGYGGGKGEKGVQAVINSLNEQLKGSGVTLDLSTDSKPVQEVRQRLEQQGKVVEWVGGVQVTKDGKSQGTIVIGLSKKGTKV